jgi:hypothetical protein
MKFYRYKQVQRLTFFGYDDVLINDPGSLSKRSPQSQADIANDTKTLRFNFPSLYHVQLSQNTRIVIEKVSLSNLVGGRARGGPITVRMNNLTTNSYDTQNGGLNSTLLYYTESPLNEFQNNYPEILYNYSIPQNFLQTGYIELQITYPDVNIVLNNLNRFVISFVVYDIDEEELVLKDTPNVDFKNYGDNIKYLHGLSK